MKGNRKKAQRTCHINPIDFYGEDTPSSKSKWEKDLGSIFEQDTWESICENSLRCSCKSRHRLTQFKATICNFFRR